MARRIRLALLRWSIELRSADFAPHRFWIAICLLFIAVFLPPYLARFSHHPPVGTYIAVMGGMAAIMTLVKDPPVREKLVWILLITVLMVAEIRNLYVADQEQAQTFRSIQNGLDETKKGLDQTVVGLSSAAAALSGISGDVHQVSKQDQQQEGSILQEMQRSTQETRDALTGGPSFVTIAPIWATDPGGSDYPLMISVVGKNTMYDVSIEMQEGELDVQYLIAHVQEYFKGELRPSYHFASVSTTYAQPLGKEIHPDPKKINEYHFLVFSRTKATSESLQVKIDPKTNRWVEAYQVSRDDMKLPMFSVDFDGTITRRPPPRKP